MWSNVLLTMIGIAVLSLFWIMLYDSSHFEVSFYRVSDPRIRKVCRAAVIADLHNKKYGRDNIQLLDRIRREKPDFILIAGDILTAKPRADLRTALDFVGELAKDFPVFYGVGNHEHRLRLYPEVYGDMAERYAEGLKALGICMMENQSVLLEQYGIAVTGSQISEKYYQRCKKISMDKDYLTNILGKADKQHFQILLAHNPDYFPQYAAWGADLVLSGHVHGGVVRIPFWNRGLFSPAVKLFPRYDGGLFSEGSSTMLLSRGLGSHTIPFRLFNPGDLIFLELWPGESSPMTKKITSRKLDRKNNR